MTASNQPDPDRQRALEGLAAIAVTCAELGVSDEQIVASVGQQMTHLGMVTASDMRDVAAAISELPQPLDESAAVRERRRPIEELLGVASPEEELSAALRARAALEAFAILLEEGAG